MSQEQPPIRSRRELRQARDERQETGRETGTPGPGAVPPASTGPASTGAAAGARPGEPTEAEITGRRRIPGPADAVRTPAGTERSSQVRARDRATLRTIKELAEKEGHLAGGGTPTRRQLRLMQLAAETAPATAANLIVPASPRTRATPVVPQPGTPGAKPSAPGGKPAPAGSPAPDSRADGGPESGTVTLAGAGAPAGQGPEGMSVEQALAARELLAMQAHNQLAKMEHINATDPDAVDPAVLAEQIALAERAAVLNRRAAAKQKLAEQNSKPEPVRNDPTTANNLAMVTPLEFVQVPGMERPVLKRPATSYVPVVTNPSPRVEPPRKPGGRRPVSSRQQAAAALGSRGGVLARAEAAAKAAAAPQDVSRPAAGDPVAARPDEDFAGRTPVAANAAYGLDPLDAATAGLARARRLRLVQLVVLALGIMALIAGITLIITGLSG
ncbi:hypothetical protein [Pseudarthrobacter sp. 1C304]|uniref:hypothetical protein n=1 Tax=Pseudarthrobacter sp. 1C304 TaxID=3457438 RepID=UPI003FD14A78